MDIIGANPDFETTETTRHVLIVGRSRLVLAEATALLHGRGHHAQGTSRFDSVLTDYDVSGFDLVVFGGQVPPDTRENLERAISTANPTVIFVQGLAGIPGLIAAQVDAAFGAHRQSSSTRPIYDPTTRTIHLSLRTPHTVTVTAWWQTSFVPPDPRSTSRVLLDREPVDRRLDVPIPDDIPDTSAFAVVQVDDAIYPLAVRRVADLVG